MRVLCLIGPQGSGKGTQARRLLAEHPGWKDVEAGALLRERAKKSDTLGRFIKRTLESGSLLPVATSSDIVIEELNRLYRRRTDLVLLDGFPRSVAQARLLLKWCTEHEVSLGALHLRLTDAEARRRLTHRVMCVGCGDSYPVEAGAKRGVAYCRRCGGHTEVRTDDTPRAINRRLGIYHQRTVPILKLFSAKGVDVINVSAHSGIEVVAKRIASVLKPWLKAGLPRQGSKVS